MAAAVAQLAGARRIYQASRIKRIRATKAAVEQRRADLLAIVAEQKPMTVRQVFYQATVAGIVEKAESGYGKVQTDLAKLRDEHALPYDWIVDNTRLQRKPTSYSSVEQALWDTAQFYRKDLWRDANAYVEIWLEKDALSGVIFPVTSLYDVPLMIARGYASLSFLHGSAEYIARLRKPAYLYHFGDHDPSGVNAGEKIEQTLRKLAPNAEIHFERVAVTRDQIHELRLPSRQTKTSDPRAKGFEGRSVELDAIRPQMLRDMVEAVINRHLPQAELRALQWVEQNERDQLLMYAADVSGGGQ